MIYIIKKAEKYFGKHVWFNSSIHVLGGIGIGILIASPIIGIHPVRWGMAFISASILGYIFATTNK